MCKLTISSPAIESRVACDQGQSLRISHQLFEGGGGGAASEHPDAEFMPRTSFFKDSLHKGDPIPQAQSIAVLAHAHMITVEIFEC